MSELDYRVNYLINVEATEGVKALGKFALAVHGLSTAKKTVDTAVKNVQDLIKGVDAVFKGKNGAPKEYSYVFKIDTGTTEDKLNRIKGLLTEIKALTTDANNKLVIDAGKKLQSNTIRSQANALLRGKQLEERQALEGKNAKAAIDSALSTQRRITKTIGKVVSALEHLQKGREVNIQTDVAKERLLEILALLNRIKGASKMTLGIQANSPGTGKGKVVASVAVAQTEDKVLTRQLHRDQMRDIARREEREHTSSLKIREQAERLQLAEQLRREREAQKTMAAARLKAENEHIRQEKAIRLAAEKERAKQEASMKRNRLQDAIQRVRTIRQNSSLDDTIYNNKRRAAINRLQYSRTPTLRNLPMMQFFNAYMAFGLLKSEIGKALEYSNIMETAHSILRVADNDLSTFEDRFDKMAYRVRQIGVETKFTAVEIAGAVKYLSMAGMDIDTINKSIRPITNLALIGDNDVSQIADLATNIMSGYNVSGNSMGSVADILASTVSRSNVNVVEMAESYKMAAGYLKLAGVEFAESSAAIGILGNSGIKGTMAGTSLRAMATRFAKPTRESRKTLDRLGVKFTKMVDIYGKQVEKLRSLADIFEDLHKSGATMGDMQAIFGKIGGNAAMMFVNYYESLRTLTNQNKASNGISGELALVKQNTTKGLWAQVTSQFTESFMQAFEVLEPAIRGTLKFFLENFKAPEFAKGIEAIGRVILSIMSTLASVGNWVVRHWNWLEPLLFTGFVATKLFKLAGALTNVGVAIGFIGKQRVSSSVMDVIGGLTGLGKIGKISFADKRSLVKKLREAGIEGSGVMAQAVRSAKMGGSASSIVGKGAASGLFASQVATGNGLIGAASSIGAMGTAAVVATGAIGALAGMLGWVAYKMWQVKKAKDAVQEDVDSKKKYRYKSIEDLYDQLDQAYRKALATKNAMDDVTAGKTLQEVTGRTSGAFTKNWLVSNLSLVSAGHWGGSYPQDVVYSPADAYQDDVRKQMKMLAEKNAQNVIDAGWADLAKQKDTVGVRAFLQSLNNVYGLKERKPEETISQKEGASDFERTPLWSVTKDGKIRYKDNANDVYAATATMAPDYIKELNEIVLPKLKVAGEAYLRAIASYAGAKRMIENEGQGAFSFSDLEKLGFTRNDKGIWEQNPLPDNSTSEQKTDHLKKFREARALVTTMTEVLRGGLGGQEQMAINVMKAAGIPEALYTNEPDSKDDKPFDANDITYGGAGAGDDGGAGGNYSGTGKLSSAAPKQVIVNIGNLLEVKTIDLLKSPEGQTAEIQNLKEQLAQALIDTVHDFDASWNG